MTDDKYALLLIDAFSSDSIPVHLLTVEAVKLYLKRLTDDGILALHISNKFVQLEPVVAAIAEHLQLVARVWNDDAEGRMHGKTASSWVVLARKREDLGEQLCSPIGDWCGKFGDDEPDAHRGAPRHLPPDQATGHLGEGRPPEIALRRKTDPPVSLDKAGYRTTRRRRRFASWIRGVHHGRVRDKQMTILTSCPETCSGSARCAR